MATDVQAAEGEHALEQLWEIRHAASPLLARLSDGRRSPPTRDHARDCGCKPIGNILPGTHPGDPA